MWQRIIVSTGADVGAPAELPAQLVGLDGGTLANLPAALTPDTITELGLADTGFLYVAEAPTLGAIQAQQLAAAQAQFDVRRQSPMAWNFGAIDAQDGTGADKGAAGSQQIDLSDANAKNLLAAQIEAQALIQAGQSTTVTALLTVSGLWVQTTAAQTQQVLLTGDGTQTSVAVRGRAIIVHWTALQAQINAATDAASCQAIDVTSGWPS